MSRFSALSYGYGVGYWNTKIKENDIYNDVKSHSWLKKSTYSGNVHLQGHPKPLHSPYSAT
jgi:hypothetical protein